MFLTRSFIQKNLSLIPDLSQTVQDRIIHYKHQPTVDIKQGVETYQSVELMFIQSTSMFCMVLNSSM